MMMLNSGCYPGITEGLRAAMDIRNEKFMQFK
jgi:hypothetical protein